MGAKVQYAVQVAGVHSPLMLEVISVPGTEMFLKGVTPMCVPALLAFNIWWLQHCSAVQAHVLMHFKILPLNLVCVANADIVHHLLVAFCTQY